MWSSLSQRLLTLLQLTRMALVFTAVADGLCTVLLSAAARAEANRTSLGAQVDVRQVLAAAAVSVGLYGFGMSLNDIIDRRRDQQISPTRPLPSGRVGLVAAHVICGLLIALALAAGSYYAVLTHDWRSVMLVAWTAGLIAFYDLAGKYLVALGLLSLGLIRFFHALVPDPTVPVLWHPLWLLNHVAILSTVSYHWEEKRPPLRKHHVWAVAGGLVAIDGMLVALLAAERPEGNLLQKLRVGPGLFPPIVATLAFIAVGWLVYRRMNGRREAGQTLMLYGLLWLIVYDAAFVAGYVRNPLATVGVLLLLPVAYLSVQLMRWWSKLVALSHPPSFKRART